MSFKVSISLPLAIFCRLRCFVSLSDFCRVPVIERVFIFASFAAFRVVTLFYRTRKNEDMKREEIEIIVINCLLSRNYHFWVINHIMD